MVKKFFRGEESLGFAFFIYGFVIFLTFRFLIAAPLSFFFNISPNASRIYMIGIKSASIIVCVSMLYGIWKCSAKNDGLPRWVARISYSLFAAVIIFNEGVVLQTMLM